MLADVRTDLANLVSVSDEVAEAQRRKKGVVAFETTILSFGLPVPGNRRVASDCDAAARDCGATPAPMAILDGQIRVGLSKEELDFFCSRDASIMKVNLQNFASALALRRPGALTVAASMQACALTGINVFATGGIGGVHRGFSRTLDISSDLRGLAQFPVAVVCAGAKSILDVPATLEALETLGVPVVGYRAKTFPLFFCADSDHRIENNFDDIGELADFCRIHFKIARSAILIVTPVPEATAIPRLELDRWIAHTVTEARRLRVKGKAVTPFMLEKMEKLSGGRTLEANKSLIVNNACLAARLAVELVH